MKLFARACISTKIDKTKIFLQFGLITKYKAESKEAEYVSDSRTTTTPSVCGKFIFNALLIYINTNNAHHPKITTTKNMKLKR